MATTPMPPRRGSSSKKPALKKRQHFSRERAYPSQSKGKDTSEQQSVLALLWRATSDVRYLDGFVK